MYISAPSPYEYLLLLIADDFFIFQGDCSSLAQKIPGTELHVSPRRETHRLPQLDNLLSGFQDLRQSRTGGFLQHEGCASESCVPVQGSRWRSELFIQVEAWHHWQRYPPCKQRTSSSNFFLGAVEEVSEFARTYIVNTDNFVDPLEDPPAAIGSEAAAAAAALAVAAGRPNGPGAGSASAMQAAV
jgi:hypothetical protein